VSKESLGEYMGGKNTLRNGVNLLSEPELGEAGIYGLLSTAYVHMGHFPERHAYFPIFCLRHLY